MCPCWNTFLGSLHLTLSSSVSWVVSSGCHINASNSFPKQSTTYFRTSSFSYLLPISISIVPCHFNPEHRSDFTCLLQDPYESRPQAIGSSLHLFLPLLCWPWSLFHQVDCTVLRPLIQVPLLFLKSYFTPLSTLNFWNSEHISPAFHCYN